jgi:transposase-like protein/predicted RNA-binding Zn-ribbon protein involved in translation (DUF1610 family)
MLTLDDFRILFPDEETCVVRLSQFGVFYESFQCTSCGRAMRKIETKGVFRCPSKRCGHREFSIRKGTFFYGSALKCVDILRLGHLWLCQVHRDSAALLTGHSPNTVTAFFKHFRQLVSSSLTEEDSVIGGPGIVIEVDETKLGKRKYHRGHRVEGAWVLVGIERTEEARVFLVPVEDRSANTLTEVLSRHVRPGSIVYTDCWKGYSGTEAELEVVHETVNHSQFFKDPDTQVCTNKAEGLNNALKIRICPRNRVKSGLTEHLAEFIWRKKYKPDLWTGFIETLRDVHYELQ